MFVERNKSFCFPQGPALATIVAVFLKIDAEYIQVDGLVYPWTSIRGNKWILVNVAGTSLKPSPMGMACIEHRRRRLLSYADHVYEAMNSAPTWSSFSCLDNSSHQPWISSHIKGYLTSFNHVQNNLRISDTPFIQHHSRGLLYALRLFNRYSRLSGLLL